MDAEEIYRRYNAGERNFTGVDLSRVNLNLANFSVLGRVKNKNNLSGINLSGANLTRANIECVDLSSANLSDANLEFATLNEVDLTNSTLRNTNFYCTNFDGVNLTNANLRGAYLVCVLMYGVDIIGGEFTCGGDGVTFCDTIMPDSTVNTEYFGTH